MPEQKAPTSVRIGPFDFAIEWVDRAAEDARKCFGQISADSQTIWLTKDRKRQRVAVTFIHEIIHGLHWVYGTQTDENERVKEEDATGAVSLGLAAFWRDNPDAAAWWQNLILEKPEDAFIQ